MLQFLVFLLLVSYCETNYNYSIIFSETATQSSDINRTIIVQAVFHTDPTYCSFNINVSVSYFNFSVYYDSSTSLSYFPNGTGYILSGSSIAINAKRNDEAILNLLNFTCAQSPYVSSNGCNIQSYDSQLCYMFSTSVTFDQSYIDTISIRNGSSMNCASDQMTTTCNGYASWWYKPAVPPLTTIGTTITTTTTALSDTTASTNSTSTTTTTPTPTTTSPSNTTLPELANQGVGLNNVTEVLNITYTYSIMGSELNSSDIIDITTILNNCANLAGISAENSVQILSNIDSVMNANENQLNSSSQNLLQIFGNMVHNTNDSRIEFLNGDNLGFSSKRVDCQNLGVDDGLVDLGSKFQSINRTSNMPSTSLNGIMIPLNDMCQSTSLTHIFFTIYRDRKLFASSQKHRIFDSQNRNTESYIVADEDDPDINDPPSRCLSQIALTSNTPVLSATVMNNGEEISTIRSDSDENNVMANLQFNVKKIPNPLHGKFQVTWWDTTSNQWADDDFCKITKKTDELITAECPHLTDFTVIVVGSLDDQTVCDSTLASIGYVVNSFSIVSLLFLTSLSILLFIQTSTIRRLILIINGEMDEGDLIVLFYYSSLLLFYFIFLCFSSRRNQTFPDVGCTIVATFMYFLLLCSIMLNIIRGIKIINEHYSGRFSRYISIIVSPIPALGICIGIPAILCILLSTLDSSFFERNDSFCWIRPDYIVNAIVIPVSLLLLNTSLCTVYVIYKVIYAPRKNKEVMFYDAKFWSKIISIILMEIALGAPWIIQYFTLAWPTTTFWNYLFTIVLGSQGTILFFIFVYKRHRVYQSSSPRSKSNQSSKN